MHMAQLLTILFVPVAAVAGADTDRLQGRLEKGKPFYQVTTTQSSQVMKMLGNQIKHVHEQTLYFRWTPEAVDQNGPWRVRFQIIGLKSDTDMDGTRIRLDSTAEPEPA
jgi:hypothetical protein